MLEFLDIDGQPIDLWTYVRLFADPDYQRLAHAVVAEGIYVSTVWLGFDHGFGRGRPQLFETMVFYALDEPREGLGGMVIDREAGECWRWSTKEEAHDGHARIVAELRSNIEVPTMPEHEVSADGSGPTSTSEHQNGRAEN